MESLHSLLVRQLKRYLGENPDLTPEWHAFIASVDSMYREFDERCEILERSLELSSQELFQANSEMRAVFQVIPDILFCTDLSGTIRDVKAGGPADLVLRREKLLGKRIQDVPDPLVAREFDKAIRQIAEGGTVSFEYNLTRNGQACFYEARLVRLLEAQVVVIIRNVTARRQLEERLRQSQKMEVIGQLAGGIAHDFNNLLTVILGSTSLLRTSALTERERVAAMVDVIKAAERAASLTRQLLTFSRRQPLRPRRINLNEIVLDMDAMLRRLIGEQIVLESQCMPGETPVHADKGMIEQLLLNLALNSRDAMPQGGRLTISTTAVRRGRTHIPWRAGATPGVYIRLSVIDTGTGIAPEHLPHLFEPFYTTKEVGKGTGLGLATAFGIVEQHGGWIDVDSHVGQGTAMHIFFPRLASRKSASPHPAPAALVTDGREKILLVEDEAVVRRLFVTVLRREGYQVHEAASGVEAVEVWENLHGDIDLLVTDMVMPGGLSGGALTQLLLSKKPLLKVIQCSGYDREASEGERHYEQHVRFLQKPFTVPKFLQQIRECLDGKQ